MSPLPPTHFHPKPLLTLAPHLTPHLPHSLPLLRRLQHHHSSPHARTLATFPPTATPPPSSYSALWIDRSRGPETECWLFSTYELPPSSLHRNNDPELARAEIIALFNTVAQLPLPPNRPPGTDYVVVGSLRENLVQLLGGEDLKYITPQAVLSTTLADLPSNGPNEDKKGGDRGGILAGISTPYMKWIIAPPATNQEENEKDLPLPPGYHYSRPLASHGDYTIVLSRTSIPRSEATLAKLGSVGIRYLPSSLSSSPPHSSSSHEKGQAEEEEARKEGQLGQLISWAFLGPDGSLTSLHVEPPHRGKGLAKAVAKRLFEKLGEDRGGVGFANVDVNERGKRGEDVQRNGKEDDKRDGKGDGDGDVEGDKDRDGAWAHSDVAVENEGSAGVARGVGGREGWVVRWCHVDLGRVRGLVARWGEGGD